MNSQLFLTIFLAVWAAAVACFATRFVVKLVLDVLETKNKAKLETARQTVKKANESGRIIGFRPIENERA